MSTIEPDTTLAELIVSRPELAARLDALGLDYCCGGQRGFADAVSAAGLDLAATTAELQSTPKEPGGGQDWEGMDGLVDHLEQTHHAYLNKALPR